MQQAFLIALLFRPLKQRKAQIIYHSQSQLISQKGVKMANLSKGPTYQKYLLDIMTIYKQRGDLQAYLEILLSIVAVGVFAVFAIKPTLVTIGGLITKNQTLQKTSNDLDTKIKNLGIAQTL